MPSSINSTAASMIRSVLEQISDRLASVNPIVLVMGSVGGTIMVVRVGRLLRRSDRPIHKRIAAYAFSWLRQLPSVRRKIDAELSSTRTSIAASIHACDPTLSFIRELPTQPFSLQEIVDKAEQYQSLNTHFDVQGGRVSGAVYTDAEEEGHLEVLTEVFKRFAFSNPLHPDVFPGCRKMEAEVIRWVANLFNGPPMSCGTMTSGGTESLILACFAYRNRAVAMGVEDPVMMVPETAHAAFDKAADLLRMRIRHVAVDPLTSVVDVEAMRRAITSDTCLLVGSAPNFPFGAVDNIPAIAKLGADYNIPVHVDACLGGFLIAFAEEGGLNHLPLFDFRLEGVTSISCDTHKYGCAPKGTSAIIYRSPDYLHHQYFSVTEWPGGIYATPTLAGSRAGLNIALTWATLLHFGREGYVERAGRVFGAARELAGRVAKVEGLEVVGRPDVSVVAFRSSSMNIYAVADRLNKKGWNLNSLQHPPSVHFCLTHNQTGEGVLDAFMADLEAACREVNSDPQKGNDSNTAAIYGMAAQIPDKSLVDEVAHIYLDSCYSMPMEMEMIEKH